MQHCKKKDYFEDIFSEDLSFKEQPHPGVKCLHMGCANTLFEKL